MASRIAMAMGTPQTWIPPMVALASATMNTLARTVEFLHHVRHSKIAVGTAPPLI